MVADDVAVMIRVINETIIQITSDINTTGCSSSISQEINLTNTSVLEVSLVECEGDKDQKLIATLIATLNTVLINKVITKIDNNTTLNVYRESVTLSVDGIPTLPPTPITSNEMLISTTDRVQEVTDDETAQENGIVYILIVIDNQSSATECLTFLCPISTNRVLSNLKSIVITQWHQN